MNDGNQTPPAMSPTNSQPVTTSLTYEKDIRPILESRCTNCHARGGVAPFSLTRYETVFPMARAIAASTRARRMPPFLAGPNCNEYEDDPSLSESEISRIEEWANGGAPRGEPTRPIDDSERTPSRLPKVDFVAQIPIVYAPQKGPDDYRCFVVDFPIDKDKYVIGANVIPGNSAIVHHVLVYVIPPEQLKLITDADAKDPAPGYPCFGGPAGDDAPGGGKSESAGGLDQLNKLLQGLASGKGIDISDSIPGLAKLPQVTAWAPGATAAMYPADTGILVKKGSKIVMQMHYNLASMAPGTASDQSKVELALADNVKRRGAVIPLTNPDWVDKDVMKLPAGQKKVTYEFEWDPGIYFAYFLNDRTASPLSGFEYLFQKYRLYSVATHQHQLGTSSRVEYRKKDGTKQCLLDVPRWDFHWQMSYRLKQQPVMESGDKLYLRCDWDNSPENQPIVEGVQQRSKDVIWGENTSSEMCVAFYYVVKE
jgi:hypothetical protein